jgi:hypothetical protein
VCCNSDLGADLTERITAKVVQLRVAHQEAARRRRTAVVAEPSESSTRGVGKVQLVAQPMSHLDMPLH